MDGRTDYIAFKKNYITYTDLDLKTEFWRLLAFWLTHKAKINMQCMQFMQWNQSYHESKNKRWNSIIWPDTDNIFTFYIKFSCSFCLAFFEKYFIVKIWFDFESNSFLFNSYLLISIKNVLVVVFLPWYFCHRIRLKIELS